MLSQALLKTVVLWLSVNFGLPATNDLPRVELVPAAKMAAVRYHGFASGRPAHVAAESGRSAPADAGEDVHALYDDRQKTIYLHERWTGATAADVSVLVHELVHHLQNLAGTKFLCPQEREKDAYKAQRAWLDLFNRTLEQEFDIDPMTVLVRANCLN
jgi:hypothetical protein